LVYWGLVIGGLGNLGLGNWWIWDDKTKNAYVAKKTVTGTDIFCVGGR
jgi:hypothetical protein